MPMDTQYWDEQRARRKAGICERTACRRPGAKWEHPDNSQRVYCDDCRDAIEAACPDMVARIGRFKLLKDFSPSEKHGD